MDIPRWLDPLLRVGLWIFRPKYLVGVFPVCINPEQQVLLVYKRIGAATGWQLPGGGKEYGVSLADSAVEELLSETGLAAYATACEQLPMQCNEKNRDVNVPFLVLRWHGEVGPRDTVEIAEARWFSLSDAEDIIYKGHRAMLADAVRLWYRRRLFFP